MTHQRRRGDVIVAGALFGFALLLGGGSVVFPLHRMVVEIVAALALCWFGIRGWRADAGKSAAAAMVLLVAALALILIQTIPLPPTIWHHLPGRSLPADVLATVGAADRWLPLSLDAAATRATALFFLVPVTVFIASLHLDRAGHKLLLMILVGFALFNGLLVVMQAQGLPWLTLYFTTPTRPGVGLFANKNHCATFLVVAMPAAAALSLTWDRLRTPATKRLVGGMMVGFLALTVFGCLSRAGIALLPLGLVMSGFILAPEQATRKQLLVTCGVVIGMFTMAIVMLPRTHIVAQALTRFSADSDERYNFWPDVMTGIRQYFPAGSGLGTFVPVFTAQERLNTVHPTYTNHAHSDYLEIALETGVAGLLLIAAFLAWLVATGWRRVKTSWRGPGRHVMLIALTGIAAMLIHSGLDYPLRTLTLASTMAMFAALLASTAVFAEAPFRSAKPGPTRYGGGRRMRASLRS